MTPTEALEIAKRIVLCTCEGETFSEKFTHFFIILSVYTNENRNHILKKGV